MIISEKHKYVFVSTPKTGTHSLFDYLKTDWDGVQAEGLYHRKDIPAEAAGYHVFTTVRHPFARTVSIWNSVTRVDPYRDIYVPLVGGEDFATFADWLMDFDPDDLQTEKGRALLDIQSDWLKGIAVDHVLHIERVDEDFAALPFVPEDFPVAVPKLLARSHPCWTTLVHGTLKTRLTDWLAQDFQQFGYSPDSVAPVSSITSAA